MSASDLFLTSASSRESWANSSGGLRESTTTRRLNNPTFPTNSNNLLSQRTCLLQSRLLVHESTVRQESSSQVDGGNKKHQRPKYPHESPGCDLILQRVDSEGPFDNSIARVEQTP